MANKDTKEDNLSRNHILKYLLNNWFQIILKLKNKSLNLNWIYKGIELLFFIFINSKYKYRAISIEDNEQEPNKKINVNIKE